jgi:CRP-like cAMP-binding protein
MSVSAPDLNRPDLQTLAKNAILASVGVTDREYVRDLLEVSPLRMRETLQEAGDPPGHVYFPTSGIISLLTVLENGMMIEFATVGREGTTAVPVFLEMNDSTMAFVSQLPGEALRMTAADFRLAVVHVPSLAAALVRYSGVLLALVAQSAACNRAHHVDARCARWLLITQDQAGGSEFPITQEFLAQMLGVSRPSVTQSAAALQKAGTISYHRGQVTILDRRKLERASCECYGVVKERFARMVG